jgi:hypothetical protein
MRSTRRIGSLAFTRACTASVTFGEGEQPPLSGYTNSTSSGSHDADRIEPTEPLGKPIVECSRDLLMFVTTVQNH